MTFIVILLCVVPDTASAGAAASLVFLICYAFANFTSIVARIRGAVSEKSFRTPLFPAVQLVGGLSCLALAVFQMFIVPEAGEIVIAWLLLGFILYVWIFSARAEALDAYRQGMDPQYLKSRGKKPFVLVPITNPRNASVLVDIAQKLASPLMGRVLLLQIAKKDESTSPDDFAAEIQNANEVLKEALLVGVNKNAHAPEALLTVAENPLHEITRVVATHHCETVVLGFNAEMQSSSLEAVGQLIASLSCNVALLSNPTMNRLTKFERVLVPLGGSAAHDALRARVLGALIAGGVKEITLLGILSEKSSEAEVQEQGKVLAIRAQDEARGYARTKLMLSSDPVLTITEESKGHDLVLLGLSKLRRSRLGIGAISLEIARNVTCPTLIIGRGRR